MNFSFLFIIKLLFVSFFFNFTFQRRIIDIKPYKKQPIFIARETIYKFNNTDPGDKIGDIIIQLQVVQSNSFLICVSQDINNFDLDITDPLKKYCKNLSVIDFKLKGIKEIVFQKNKSINNGKGIYYIQIKVEISSFSSIKIFNKNDIYILDTDKPNLLYFFDSYSENYVYFKIPKLSKNLNLTYEFGQNNYIEIFEYSETKKKIYNGTKFVSSIILVENKEYLVNYTINKFDLDNYIIISFNENSNDLKEEGIIKSFYSFRNLPQLLKINLKDIKINEIFYLYVYGIIDNLTIITYDNNLIQQSKITKKINNKYTILSLEKKKVDESIMHISFISKGENKFKLLPKIQKLEKNKKEKIETRKAYFYQIPNKKQIEEKKISIILYASHEDSMYLFSKNKKDEIYMSKQMERIIEVKSDLKNDDYVIFLYGENDFMFEYYEVNSNSRKIEIINHDGHFKIKNRKMKKDENYYFLIYSDYLSIPIVLYPYILYGEVEYYTNKENQFSLENIYTIKQSDEIKLNYYREIPHNIQYLHIKPKYDSELKIYSPIQIIYNNFNVQPKNYITYSNKNEEFQILSRDMIVEIEIDDNQPKQELKLLFDNKTLTINKNNIYQKVKTNSSFIIKVTEGNNIIKLLPNPKYEPEYILNKTTKFIKNKNKTGKYLVFVFPPEKKQTVRAVIKSNFTNITSKIKEGYMGIGIYPYFAHDDGYASQNLVGNNNTIYISNPYRKPGKKLKKNEVYYYLCQFQFNEYDAIDFYFENDNSKIIFIVICIIVAVILLIFIILLIIFCIKKKTDENNNQEGVSLVPKDDKYEKIV